MPDVQQAPEAPEAPLDTEAMELGDIRGLLSGTPPAPAPPAAPKPETPEIPAVTPQPAGEVTPPAGSENHEPGQGSGEQPTQEQPAVQPPAEPPVEQPKGETKEERVARKLEKRFSRVTGERDEAVRRAEAAEAELARLKAAPTPGSPQTPAPAAEGKPQPPDFDALPFEQHQKAMLEYSEKLSAWLTDQRIAKLEAKLKADRENETAAAQATTIDQKWQERCQVALKENDELTEAIAAVGPIATKLGMADFIKESELGPELVLHLYENPEAAARIGSRPTVASRAKELGKLEAELIAAKKAAAKPPAPATPTPPKPTAKLPEPLPKPPATPGGGGSPEAPALEDLEMGQFRKAVTPHLRNRF